jgi:hypothetical protein
MSETGSRLHVTISPWLVGGILFVLGALLIGFAPLVDCPRCVKIQAMLDDALARSGPNGPVIVRPFQKCRICSERHKTTLFQRCRFAIAEEVQPGDYP